jgi:hypothetical protein
MVHYEPLHKLKTVSGLNLGGTVDRVGKISSGSLCRCFRSLQFSPEH